MEALDATIINVALPQMGGNMGAAPNRSPRAAVKAL